jgi:hypothetical protein
MKLNIKGWKREEQTVGIKNRTHLKFINHVGERVPTFKNMERQLIKSLKYGS